MLKLDRGWLGSTNAKAGRVDHWLHFVLCWDSLGWWENFPEPQRFIACSSYYIFSIGAHCKIQDSHAVTRQCCHFLHRWVLPHNDSIIWVTVRAYNFVHILAEMQIADLRPSFNCIDLLHLSGVPESNASVSSATSTSQKSMLVRRPRYGLDCSQMTSKLTNWFILVVHRPNIKLVVIATRCQLLFIEWPLETTYFLFMALKATEKVVFFPQVSLQDCLVFWPRA